jgi:hypothetical protein
VPSGSLACIGCCVGVCFDVACSLQNMCDVVPESRMAPFW